jgi:hypothetical protein
MEAAAAEATEIAIGTAIGTAIVIATEASVEGGAAAETLWAASAQGSEPSPGIYLSFLSSRRTSI